MRDDLKLKGSVHIKAIDVATGKVIKEIIGRNMVVNVGRNIVCHLLNNSQGANQHIDHIEVGTSLTAATLADTSITAPVSKTLNNVSFPTDGQVDFEWSLEVNEGNGVAIAEFGLFCADGSMFARKVCASNQVINKTASMRIEGIWSITI